MGPSNAPETCRRWKGGAAGSPCRRGGSSPKRSLSRLFQGNGDLCSVGKEQGRAGSPLGGSLDSPSACQALEQGKHLSRCFVGSLPSSAQRGLESEPSCHSAPSSSR